MLDLALAVASSLSIGMIFKHAARRGMDRPALLTVNYAAAFALGALFVGGEGLAALGTVPPGLLVLGVGTGTLFIVGFFLLALATEVAGMSLAVGVMRVSVVIPFLASWAVWGEVPSPAQGAGLVVAAAAFFLIARKERAPAETPAETRAGVPAGVPAGVVAGEPDAPVPERTPAAGGDAPSSGARAFLVLALLFAAGGTVDVLMKAFDEAYAAAYREDVFLVLLFAVAFGIGAAVVLVRGIRTGRWPRTETLLWGLALGAVNYASAKFLLRAIRALSGPFVFPANNIAIVIGAALLGVFFWHERLSRTNWIGLGLAAAALILLGLGR